jgi:hypothetical protein
VLIDLRKAREARSKGVVPLSYVEQLIDGVAYKEPFFDLNDEGDPEDYGFEDEPRDPTTEEFIEGQQFVFNVSPSEFTETAIMIADKGDTHNFSFDQRPYLTRVYDTGSRQTLLKCGRQVEKCGFYLDCVLYEDGSVRILGDTKVGDRVVGLAPDGSHTAVGVVSWKSDLLLKPCVKITTRQGHSTILALEHPLRSWGEWDAADLFEVGDKIAVVREGGVFTNASSIDDRWLVLSAYMVAEGSTAGTPVFTQQEGCVLDEFVDLADDLGAWFNPDSRDSSGGRVWMLRFVRGDDGKENPLKDRLVEWGIYGERSADKHVPDFVWGLDRRQTALFLNRLWSSDGHASLQNSSYHLEYDTISERLARDVQRLLWKFGIPSSFRRWKPELYKNTDKWAFKVRIETQDGAKCFISHVGALGKTEDLPLIDVGDNSNRDVFPLAIAEDIKSIHRSRDGFQRRGRFVPQPSLRSAGLREKPKYNLSREKLLEYINFFRSDERFDQELVGALAAHLDTDLFWDEIVSIEDVGEQPCYDITVQGTDSFVSDGFITHNSTTLGNKMIGYSCLNNHFRSLFVAPSAEQAKVFSNDRVADPINMSPLVQAYTNTSLTNAVFHKKFINYSQIRLRYAYLTADRVRGIPADLITVDEIQDILVDNIPVIEECASHSDFKIFIYSGTPKSLDNTIEYYWANYSTQNEWLVPCRRHGTPKNPQSWHWNILDEDNIGPNGLVCDKCKKPIDPYDPECRWASLNPQTEKNKDKVTFEAFRIPQLMVPWIVLTKDGWAEILRKQEHYSRQKFYNECLGISYDSGTRPITRAQLKACCKDTIRLSDYESFMKYGHQTDVFAGVDWGTGEQTYTVIVLGAYLGSGNFTIFWAHRFTGRELEPPMQLDMISTILTKFNVSLCGCDYGGGFDRNDHLIRVFGPNKILKYQYNHMQKKGKIYWEEKLRRFAVHRTEVMSDVFNALIRKQIDLPAWDDFFEPHGQDILNIFSEYNERLRMVEYKHAPGSTDDTFHSILLCFLASMIKYPRPDIIAPLKDTPDQEYPKRKRR